jgi:hypothetical protein
VERIHVDILGVLYQILNTSVRTPRFQIGDFMARKPVKCKQCEVYLSAKKAKTTEQLCNRCSGVKYSPKMESGRKILH